MTAGLTYQETPPPVRLRGIVRCVWALRGPAAARSPQPVVPDACPEIVFNLADAFVRRTGTGIERQPGVLLVGPTTAPALIAPSGRCRVVGIRLQPWAGFRVLDTPMAELRDAYLGGTALPPWIVALHGRLGEMAPERRAPTIYRELERRIDALAPGASSPARAVVEAIVAGSGDRGVGGIARDLGMTRRSVQRALHRDVGLPPTTVSRIVRVQRALRALLAGPDRPLGSVAVRAGFYDQSHFIREFRRLVGCTPSEFLKSESEISAAFVEHENPPA